jgi:hypothetical protein
MEKLKLSQKLREHLNACKACALSMAYDDVVAMDCDKGGDLALDNERDLALEKKEEMLPVLNLDGL